jgi:subtilisin-like proprotein convertase family protein
MKKLLQLTFILLLSLSVYPQSRKAMPVSNNDNLNQSPIFQLLISEDNSHIYAQRDNDFLMDMSYFYWWNDWNDIYDCTRRYYYTYDVNHNLTERLEKFGNELVPIEKRIYGYDANNNMTDEYVYDYTGSGWINTKQILYTYNAVNNNLIFESSKVLDGGVFIDETRTTYEYDDNNNRDYFIEERWDKFEQVWVNSLMWMDDFDDNNNRWRVIIKHWPHDGNDWVNNSIAFYTYDEETNNLLMISGNNWDEEISGWGERIQRNTYTYDADNNRTIMEIDEKYDSNAEWHKIMLEAYYYVPIGSETVTHMRTNLDKSIEDLQTTEDELHVTRKQASRNRSLYGIEVLIDSILHTSDGDLEFSLTHNGITETIIYKVGGDGDNFINTKLSDKAIDTISNGMAPFSGIYKADNELSAFLATDPEGTWTLSIYDGVAGNTGTLKAWGLNFIYAESSGVEDELAEAITFKLFPNPASDIISLQSSVFSRQSAVVEIFDLNGRKLLEKHFSKSTKEIEIDVSHLPSGVYFCLLNTENKSVTKKLIIK